MAEQEFHLNFTDITMLEADGEFDAVAQLMVEEEVIADDWMLKSGLEICMVGGACQMVLHLYYNRDIYIADYAPSVKDVFYNTDLSALSLWAQAAGWHVPRPHPDLIRDSLGFWMHFWESGVVDSEYLTNLYGKREYVDAD